MPRRHDGGEEEFELVAALEAVGGGAEEEAGGEEEHGAGAEGEDVETAEGFSDDEAARWMVGRVWKAFAGEDEGEEDEAANPDDDGEELDEAEEGLHELNLALVGWGRRSGWLHPDGSWCGGGRGRRRV